MKQISVLFWVLVLHLGCAVGAGADSGAKPKVALEDLLARHLDWLGGRAVLDRVQSITITGRLDVSGLSGTFQTVQHRSGLLRTDYDLGVIKGSQGVARGTAWVVDGTGRTAPMGSVEADVARREVARSFGAHLLRSDGSTLEDLGEEEKDGRTWRVARFSYPGGDLYDLFLDPSDGAYTWVRERRDLETFWHRFDDWRMVDGLRVPFLVADLHDNPANNQSVTIDRVDFKADVTAAMFAPPEVTAKQFGIDGDAAATDWIPMQLFRGAYIYLRGSINGTDTDILLDSGAGMTVLDKSFAADQGISTAGEVVASGTGGESTASFANGVTIRVGTLELRDLNTVVIDLGGIAAQLGRPVPVILGKEVFHSVVVDIDYPGNRLRFAEPGQFRYDGPGRRLPVLPAEGGHTEIEVSIEGLPPVRVGLDTGSGAALDLFGSYVDERHLLEGRPRVSEALSGGVGGMRTDQVTSLRQVEIAGFPLLDVPVGIARSTTGAFATKRVAGNLGAGILKRFRIAFDYPHECLWLEPRPDTENGPFERNRSGLGLVRRDGACEVEFIAPGSPSEAAGWKVGERIIAVDGTPVGDTYVESIDRFAARPEGTVVSLRLEDGTERKLVLARYY